MDQAKFQARQAGKALRRSKRLKLVVPVEVIALEGESVAFREAAEMLSVNAHGGLLNIAAGVREGQMLRLVNRRTSEQQECRVVSVGSAPGGKRAVGIEFVSPALNFWQISFPPVIPRAPVQSQN
ncbi:MAG TPA: hypothetical protein VGR72_05520 [Candidatus Acidoferrales bacterium]|nr:hypothetical protein [Candidatus Acidoferrales bacterium]